MIDDLIKEVEDKRRNHGYRDYIENKYRLFKPELRKFEEDYRSQEKFQTIFKRAGTTFEWVGRYFSGLETYIYKHKKEV